MRIGIVTYWFNRGQAVVSRQIREHLEEIGMETYVLARPTRKSFSRPFFIDDSDVWAQPNVTPASHYQISEKEYLDWVTRYSLEVVLFDQNLQFDEIETLRRNGVKTIGRFVWESFGPDDVEGAKRAFDVVYSLTKCEQQRYQKLGIRSPRVRWGWSSEVENIERPIRKDNEVRFLYPGGYLSVRKPTDETIEAFCRVSDPRARLIIKVQHPVKGPMLAKHVAMLDHRIKVISEDLPTEEHYRLMASTDVCLAPTRWEGLGIHHYEAIALGLPTITNDFPPMNELVTHDVDGWLVASNWTSERRPGVPKLETPVDGLLAGIEALCDDKRRRRLEHGVLNRRATMNSEQTVQDLKSLVYGCFKTEGDIT